jgi:bacterioferritin-associated ferredoxin
MIICLCHRVSDRDIVRAVREGTRNFDVLQDDLLVAVSCACCHDSAKEIFDAACSACDLAPVGECAARSSMQPMPG